MDAYISKLRKIDSFFFISYHIVIFVPVSK